LRATSRLIVLGERCTLLKHQLDQGALLAAQVFVLGVHRNTLPLGLENVLHCWQQIDLSVSVANKQSALSGGGSWRKA
jgi:hypothetical protein